VPKRQGMASREGRAPVKKGDQRPKMEKPRGGLIKIFLVNAAKTPVEHSTIKQHTRTRKKSKLKKNKIQKSRGTAGMKGGEVFPEKIRAKRGAHEGSGEFSRQKP